MRSLRHNDTQIQQQPGRGPSIELAVHERWCGESSREDATAKVKGHPKRTQGQEDQTATANGKQKRNSALTQFEPNGATHA